MRNFAITALLAMALTTSAPALAKGCIRGAIVGGIAGHYAGHHAVAGAMGGCVAGHVYYKHKAKAAQHQHAMQARPIHR